MDAVKWKRTTWCWKAVMVATAPAATAAWRGAGLVALNEPELLPQRCGVSWTST